MSATHHPDPPNEPPQEAPIPSDPKQEPSVPEAPQPVDPGVEPEMPEVPEPTAPTEEPELDPFDNGNFPI